MIHTKILRARERQRAILQKEIERVSGAIAALTGAHQPKQGRRRMSAAARARISKAQKARWAAEQKK